MAKSISKCNLSNLLYSSTHGCPFFQPFIYHSDALDLVDYTHQYISTQLPDPQGTFVRHTKLLITQNEPVNRSVPASYTWPLKEVTETDHINRHVYY